MSASEAWNAALRLLARRDRSEAELIGALRRKGCTEESIVAAVERGRQLGYLDDCRFARGRARALMAQGRAVGFRLLADLRRHGIDEGTAEAALAEARREIGDERLLEEILQRRFPRFRFAGADDGERRRVVHYFLRRGFPLAQVLEFIRQERQTEGP